MKLKDVHVLKHVRITQQPLVARAVMCSMQACILDV